MTTWLLTPANFRRTALHLAYPEVMPPSPRPVTTFARLAGGFCLSTAVIAAFLWVGAMWQGRTVAISGCLALATIPSVGVALFVLAAVALNERDSVRATKSAEHNARREQARDEEE